uniref:non-specific serine/threonine protein kinase n=1 Tax=Cyclopterus lumpus TaxID=8103 RepID=A0A8C2XK67_CYCLU
FTLNPHLHISEHCDVTDCDFIEPAAQSERTMFKAKYRQQKKLGEGGCGCVYAGYRREDNLPVSFSHVLSHTYRHTEYDTDGLHIPMEVAVLRKLEAESERHSAHVDLLDWYIVDEELILVLERPMPAVDLSNYIESKGGHLKEKEAKVSCCSHLRVSAMKTCPSILSDPSTLSFLSFRL